MEPLPVVHEIETLKHYLLTRGVSFLGSLAAAVAILVLGRMVARVLARMLCRLLERSGTDVTLVKFLNHLVYALMLVFVVVAALEKVGINTTSFAAIAAAAGLAIGLALQASLSNFASGTMIIINRHFRVGDRIEAAGQSGVVSEIQIFSSVLIGDDGTRIILPNSAVMGGTVKVFAPLPTASPKADKSEAA